MCYFSETSAFRSLTSCCCHPPHHRPTHTHPYVDVPCSSPDCVRAHKPAGPLDVDSVFASCSVIEECQACLRKQAHCSNIYISACPQMSGNLEAAFLTSPVRLWAQHLLQLFFWHQMKLFRPDLLSINHSVMHVWVPANITVKPLTLLELGSGWGIFFFRFWLTFTAARSRKPPSRAARRFVHLQIKLTHELDGCSLRYS